MAIKISGTTVVSDTRSIVNVVDATFTGNSAITLPVGTTAQRPTPAVGMLRYNTTIDSPEYYSSSSTWKTTTASGITGTMYYMASI